VLQQYLALAGYRVVAAEDGDGALARAREVRPDLVLLDVQLPGADGFEVLSRLRALSELRDTPVLFLTSLATRHLKVRGLEAGADDYLTKPVDRAELVARVRAALRRAERYRHADRLLAGDVREVGLDTLLQTYQLSGKRGCIRLPELAATLQVGDGALACEWRCFRGAAALARLLLQPRGAFVVEPDAGPLPAGAEPIASLLVAAAVALDDLGKVLRDAGLAEQAELDIVARGCADDAIEALRPTFPLSLLELVAALPGRLDDNATAVWSALIAGELHTLELAGPTRPE
ncbi:MAG: response regulator, partial [Polyangiaceae bacterium]|nr:response regulator [Polyangiaceae bacterium]